MIDSPVALITGGGSGIGAAVARQLLGAGHRVAVTGRGEARLRGFAEELGDPDGLLTIVGDAADHDDVQAAVAATLKQVGRADRALLDGRRSRGAGGVRGEHPGGEQCGSGGRGEGQCSYAHCGVPFC
jgi:uncharacterized protein YbjT (DUF2867 family)